MLRFLKSWQRKIRTPNLAEIRLLVLDVDGVLTDGGLWLDQNGRLQKRFDVRDGLGIHLLQDKGITIAFLSGGEGGATEARAMQLGVKNCLVGIKDKLIALKNLQKTLGFTREQTAFIGDDLNDLAVRSLVSLFITPKDACYEVKRSADWVLSNRGGHGAVREAAEGLLKSQKGWKTISSEGWRGRND